MASMAFTQMMQFFCGFHSFQMQIQFFHPFILPFFSIRVIPYAVNIALLLNAIRLNQCDAMWVSEIDVKNNACCSGSRCMQRIFSFFTNFNLIRMFCVHSWDWESGRWKLIELWISSMMMMKLDQKHFSMKNMENEFSHYNSLCNCCCHSRVETETEWKFRFTFYIKMKLKCWKGSQMTFSIFIQSIQPAIMILIIFSLL